jgi:DNA-binding NarL/FixJ family response regulator
MAKELTQRQMASMGGKSRARRHTKREISAWGALGGRPRALTPDAMRELLRLEKRGLTQREIAGQLGVSLSTVVRALAYKKRKLGTDVGQSG